MKILIVDDDENSRMLHRAILETEGHEVTDAKNGREALELAKQHSYDLIVSDILMPEMDGFELCRSLKSSRDLAEIPFMFYTATYTAADDREFADAIGAEKYLLKPMDADEFLAEVDTMLQTRKRRPSLKADNFNDRHTKTMLRKLCEKTDALDYTGKLLQTTETRYRQIVEALNKNYFFYIYDQSGELNYVSPSSLVILGCKNDDEMNGLMRQLVGGPFDKSPRERSTQQDYEPVSYEVLVPRGDGSEAFLEVLETPIFDDDDRLVEVLGVAQDVTERKHMEADRQRLEQSLHQAKKMEIIGNMASGIAHDFNNMLLSITGYTELLRMGLGEHDAESMHITGEILAAAKRAELLIKQMLTISRRGEAPRKPVNISKTVDEAMSLVHAAMPKQISLEYRSASEPLNIMADETQMVQLIMNLCVNAIHAIGEHHGTVTLSLEPFRGCLEEMDTPSATYACIHVQDTGCGMNRETMDHIFEPYFTTRKRDRGTGLGLAMVQSIVQHHGGTVHVASQPGKGSLFSVYLPLNKAMDPGQSIVDESTRACIMFADEQSSIADVICSMLTLQDWVITNAATENEALEHCADGGTKFDAMLVDKSGAFDVGTFIRQVRASCPGLPVILIQNARNNVAIEQEGVHLLRPPFTGEELLACMEKTTV
ncbi:MAG: response regulator [Spartobacteria bacterium]|nr:response regulator [Spartobacteria bacterium]